MDRLPLAESGSAGIPVHLLTRGSAGDLDARVPADAARWAQATGFDGSGGRLCLVPDADGGIGCALYGLGKAPSAMDAGKLARLLPAG
ncbi:MAG: leucyl aminopeptidase family protein, partial [Pseudomonadota bacterium]|nr:leucyl aminopeptidase family protein [Pseudomonadota bacterium]